MKKTLKLKKNYEFKKILTRGKYYGGHYLDVFVIRNRSNINQIGIAVSVKVAKAVKRNRIKRLIRENYKIIESKINSGINILIIINNNANIENISYIGIKKDFEKILKKARVL